jgi:hypothetical protein
VSKTKRVRLSITTSLQVGEAIERLLWSGLYGNNRATVVERLLCERIEQLMHRETLVHFVDVHEDAAKCGYSEVDSGP